ncbi:MAG TPA: nucleotidyltransferase domain-containing protein [Kofleriaceae bacterium]|nr:nucleotidyltransferase domain-containing protein [Kofleriaceae bacterium]
MSDDLVARLGTLAAQHGGATDHLVAGIERSGRAIAALRSGLQRAFGPDGLPGADVLAVGSVARGMCTRGSDIDFYAITDAELPAETSAKIVEVVLRAAEEVGLEAPNAVGPLGRAVPRSEVETVHPMDDFPKVMRRMTLVTTSRSLYRSGMRAEVLARVVDAFLGRDREPRIRGVVDQLIRLLRLSNMLTEMMLGMKTADGGLVHWAKVNTLYRLEVASCLAAVFQAETACAGRPRQVLLDDLIARFERSPCQRLLDVYDALDDRGRQWLASLLFTANDVLRLLGTEGVRERLAANDGGPETERLRAEILQLIEPLEGTLFRLFYQTDVLGPLTERLALFG